MRVIKAPEPIRIVGRSVFLAGSIDMGKAVDWQKEITDALSAYDVTILNPRRDDFDPDLEQSITEPRFVEQVEWELNALDRADVIAMYFDPAGKAPITLAELGLHAKSGKLVVCCPEGYWRRGNVQVMCKKYRIPLTDSIQTLINAVKARVAIP